MTPAEHVDRAIRQCARAVDPSGAVCTGWVLVSEWQDASGRWWVHRWTDSATPPWRADGLMYHAIQSEEVS